jgi:hypothetical protein
VASDGPPPLATEIFQTNRIALGERSISAAAKPAAAITASAALTAAATAISTSTTTTTTRPLFPRLRFVHRQRAAANVLTIEGADGGFRLIVAPHLDKAEPFAAAGFPIRNDFGALDLAVRLK